MTLARMICLFALTSTLVAPAFANQLDVPASGEAMSELAAIVESSEKAPRSSLPLLPDLFERALHHDSQLSRQLLELEATKQEIPLARSRLLPQLSASGGYLWQDSTNIQTSPEDFGLDQPAQRPGTIDENFWELRLEQSLFSLERWRDLDRANFQVGAAELDVALAERDLALQVTEAYVDAYLASRKLGLLEAQQEALELQSRQAERAYDLGVGDRINLLEARSRLDQAVADAVMADNDLDDALSELERLTGSMPDFGDTALGDLGSATIRKDWGEEQEWMQRIGNNLRVLRAQAEKEVAASDTRVRRSGYYPELNLNLSYADRNSDDELRSSEDYRAVLEVRMPLYRGGYTTASVRQGELRTLASQEVVDHEQNLAAQEVRRSLRSLQGNIRRIEALNRAIESSELFLQAAERGEQLGLRDLVDVLDARASLYDQRIQFVDTIGSYVLDRLALQSAVGELGTHDLEQIMTLLESITYSGA